MSKKKQAKENKKIAKKQTQKTSKEPLMKRLLPALVIAIFGFLIYSNTLSHDYALDDFSAIKENFVTKQGVEGIPTIMTTSYRYGYWLSNGTLYRPLSLVMFAMEWQMAPDSPGLSHFVNVFLYAMTGLLLFFCLSRVMKDYTILLPFLTALFFIAHPVHVEVVANIKSRDEIMAFLFCLGAVYCLWGYLKSEKMSQLVFAILSYTMAMFSKENALTFLAVIPLMIYFFTKVSIEKNLKISAFFLIPIGIYFATRRAILGAVTAGTKDTSPLDNLLTSTDSSIEHIATAFVLLGKYLAALIFPFQLVSDVGYSQIPVVGMGSPVVIVSILIFVGLTIWAILNMGKKAIWAFGILYSVITFSIFSNLIIVIGSSYGERFLYMASLGFAMILAWVVLKFSNVDLAKSKGEELFAMLSKYKMAAGIALLIVGLYATRTLTRNPVWENSYTLYHADIKTSPNSAKLNYHYALEQIKMGNREKNPKIKNEWYAKGKTSFEKAISIYPKYHDAYGELGLAFYRLGQKEKALENYALSLQHKPNNANVYSNMGIIYFERKDLNKAQEVYEKAVQINPRFVDARRNLGSVFAQKKEFNKAIAQFKEALKYDPKNPTIHQYLGFVYRDMGDNASSQQWLQKAAALGAK